MQSLRTSANLDETDRCVGGRAVTIGFSVYDWHVKRVVVKSSLISFFIVCFFSFGKRTSLKIPAEGGESFITSQT